jgi:biofilm PGA synthesis protein PgaA
MFPIINAVSVPFLSALPRVQKEGLSAGVLFLFLVVTSATGSQSEPQSTPIPVAREADRALMMIDQGRLDDAQALLNRMLSRPYRPDSLPLLRARAVFSASKRDFVAEAAAYQDILDLAPDDRAAVRGRVFATLRMGAPQLAVRYAKLNVEAFSAVELLDLQQAAVGRSIKWGELEARAGSGPQRFQATDNALTESADLHAAHLGSDTSDSPSAQRAEFDRIVVLRNRARMREAIALYRDLSQRRVQVPAYALAAVADAYLYQQEPERARDLYLQALSLSKNDRDYPNREWQFQLFDAYVDANEFDAARKLIDQLEREIPPLINQGLPGIELENEFYAQARVNAARLRLYADQLSSSESMLNQLLASAPFNLDARLAQGDLLNAHDKPRAAQEQFNTILVDDPASIDAAIGIAETALTLHDPGTAKSYIDLLEKNYPESRAVQRLQHELAIYQRPILTLTSELGRSPTGGGNKGNSDWLIDATLYSAPIHDHWRVFAHSFNAAADFDDETATRKRIGLGGEYRASAWEASVELNQKQFALDEIGVSLRSAWLPNDQWRLSLEFDTKSNNIPLRASATGVDARALGFGVTYSKNESTKLNASLGQLRFSDGNHRTQTGADWTQRWVSGPVYKLDTRLGVFASHNTLTEAAYFNPQRDLSLDLSVTNEWTLWRRYERSFKHRIELGVGRYWQKDFGAKLSTGVRYEHEWSLDKFRTLSYGVGYNRQPFDGVMDKRRSLFLNLTWHF